MSQREKMEAKICETISSLDENYVRKVMIYANTLYEIQEERK